MYKRPEAVHSETKLQFLIDNTPLGILSFVHVKKTQVHASIFSRVLRDSISHFLVGRSVRPSVGPLDGHKTVLKAYLSIINVRQSTSMTGCVR